MNISRSLVAGCLLAAVFQASPLRAYHVEEFHNDFQDGGNAGWEVGSLHPNPPVVMPDGGPGGDGDQFLLLTADGTPASPNAPGSRLLVFNGTQWNGDYLAEGIAAILMDMANFSDVDLSMRLAINGPAGYFVSTNPVTLPANSGWSFYLFPVGPADLSPDSGDGDPLMTLTAVSELRLFHNPEARFFGSLVSAQIGVDNFQAVIVPLPTGAMAALTLLGFKLIRRTSGRRIG